MRRREFIAGLGGAAAAAAIGGAAVWSQNDQIRALRLRILRLQAESAASMIEQFIREVESQIGWTTQLPWSADTIDQRRFDGSRLLRQVPAITELAQLDSTGKEQLRQSKLAMEVIGSLIDFSHEAKFTEAVAKKVYYGPVYLRRESEPYMTLALAGIRKDAGVSVAEVGLRLAHDVVRNLKVGAHGIAYIIDAKGRVIFHPDISLELAQTDVRRLPQLMATRATPTQRAQVVKDINGRQRLVAYAAVEPPRWLLFVEIPLDGANALAQ